MSDTATLPARFSMMGIDAVAMVTDTDTAGAWEAIEQTVSPGSGSPLHTIGGDKLFYVVAGTLDLTIGDEVRPTQAGGFAFVPGGTPHRFHNASGTPATLVVVAGGGGHVRFLQGLSEMSVAGTLTPERMRAHGEPFGVRFMPPREA
jgi:quercetin dioxygenase-like cupin family protein